MHPELNNDLDPDSSADLRRFSLVVKREAPDLVGVSATSCHHAVAEKLAGYLKRHGFRMPIILGGAHATFCPEDFATSHFDAFCVGEGERPLLELCRRIEQGCPREHLFRDLPSFVAREVHGSRLPQPIPLAEPIEDLDTLAPPDRDLFDMATIIRSRQGWVDVCTARGCPHSCTYCCNNIYNRIHQSSFGAPRRFRQRSVRSVIDEILSLKAKYGEQFRVVSFQEDFLNCNRRWMLDFCAAYAEEVALPFYMNGRADSVDAEMALALKRAGCREFSMGIETGSDTLRNIIYRKKVLTETIRHACLCLTGAGVDVFANIMVGAPGETWHSLSHTVRLLAELTPRLVRVSILVPMRGTDLYSYCHDHGLLSREPDHVRSLFEESCLRFEQFSPQELMRFRYLLGWKVNIAMRNVASRTYDEACREFEQKPIEGWANGLLHEVVAVDAELSKQAQRWAASHYRFFNGPQEMQDLGHVKRFELCRPGSAC